MEKIKMNCSFIPWELKDVEKHCFSTSKLEVEIFLIVKFTCVEKEK
jgi:hypothetical protein